MTSLSKSLVKFRSQLTRHRMPFTDILYASQSSYSQTDNRQYRRYQSKAQANLILLGSDRLTLADIVAGTVVP